MRTTYISPVERHTLASARSTHTLTYTIAHLSTHIYTRARAHTHAHTRMHVMRASACLQYTQI